MLIKRNYYNVARLGVGAICIVLSLLLAGCGGGEGFALAAANVATEVPHQSAAFQVPVTKETTITISDPTSPISGTKIVIPKDAAIDPLTVVVGYEDSLPASLNADAVAMGAVQVSKVIIPHVIGGGPFTFNHLIEITIPYDKTKANGLPPIVVYWDVKNKIYRPVAVVKIDRANGLVTFKTSHFSRFMAIVVKALGVSAPDIDTGFRMGIDSILHQNFGSYEWGGHCMAFASMASHYFSMKNPIKLYAFAQDGVIDQQLDDELVRSALTYTYALLASKYKDVAEEVNKPSKIDTGLLVLQAMIITKQPVNFIVTSSIGKGAHSVAVYGYDSMNAQFRIYDSNFPKDEVTFDWNLLTGFGAYSKAAAYDSSLFDNIGFFSDDTLGESSQFEKIISDWKSGALKDFFSNVSVNDDKGIPQILSFNSNVKIVVPSIKTVTLSGHFNSPANNKNKTNYLWVMQNGKTLPATSISASGDFNFDVDGTNAANTEVVIMVSGHQRDKFTGFAAYGKFTLTGQSFFKNFGFETGDFSNWSAYTYLRNTGSIWTPTKAYIVMPGFDAIATDIPTVIAGKYAAKVNDSDPNFHATLISQKATVPNIGSPQISFHWAAVLEDPQHTPADQPYVDVIVRDNTKAVDLYHNRFYTGDPNYTGWKNYTYNGSNWKAIPWQTVILSGLAPYAGDELELIVEGADCGLGGHGGYLYIDGEE